MAGPAQASIQQDLIKLLEGEMIKHTHVPPSQSWLKRGRLLERMMATLRQYENAIQKPEHVDMLPGATMEMKKVLKKLLDEVLNPGFLPQRGSGGHAILVAMLKAKQQGKLEMPIEKIKDAAEATHLCKHSFYSKGGQAWKAMVELEREKLVARQTGAIMHKPGLYFTNVAGSQHQLRLTAKGVKVAERMLFLAGPNQGSAPVESRSRVPNTNNLVPIAPPAPVKERPKKDNVVKSWEMPKQASPSIGRNLPDWMNQANKRPRVTSLDARGTGPGFERNVVRKLFKGRVEGEVQGQLKHEVKKEVKKEVKMETRMEISVERPQVAASGSWAFVKKEHHDVTAHAAVKEEGDVTGSKVGLGALAAPNTWQPFRVNAGAVWVKEEET
eukprot:TRINITY_DN6295_c0_g1_i1.p1 TRINITY_DN6295_c0_g1~~TRINITY_DN6295_c0_g1_i1.p1  ORF type:complete len:385 (+),score=50.60 TRINITY_DN6295_c0_g1_i1:173-1327(+)